MASDQPWNMQGLSPQVRETAREAARRSGLSVAEWLQSVIVDSAAQEGVRVAQRAQQDRHETRLNPGEQHDRKAWEADHQADELASRMERMTRTAGDTHIPQARDSMTDQNSSDVARVLQSLEERLSHIEQSNGARSASPPASFMDRRRDRDPVESAAIPGVVESRAPWPNARDDNFTTASQPRAAEPAVDETDFDPRPTLRIPPRSDDEVNVLRRDTAAPARQALPPGSEHFSGLDETLAEITERQRVLDAQHDAAAEAGHAEPTPKAAKPTSLGERLATLSRRLSARRDTESSRNEEHDDDRTAASAGDEPARQETRSAAPQVDMQPRVVQAAAVFAQRQEQESASRAEAPRSNTLDPLLGLQAQLQHLTQHIAGMRDPAEFDDTVKALREELASIARMLDEAVPRRALEALEAEVRTLGERIDVVRERGVDPTTISTIEGNLSDILQTLQHVAPAESLAAFQKDVRALDDKIESIAQRGATDENALRQVERSVAELREITSRAASGEALVALAEEVQSLGDKLDRTVTPMARNADLMSRLETRLEDLAASINADMPERAATHDKIIQVVESLAERFERDETSKTPPILDQITNQLARLAVKFEASSARLENLDTIERTLSDLFTRLDDIRLTTAASAENAARQAAFDAVSQASGTNSPTSSELDALKEEFETLRHENAASERRTRDTIESVRHDQSLSDRRTQDTLEAVHDTLERLVDRLAMVESDMRGEAMARLLDKGPAVSHEPPHAAQMHGPMPQDPSPRTLPPSAAPQLVPSHDEPPAHESNAPPVMPERRPIDPSLPADHPLEPGTAAARRPQTAAERIAASEALLGPAKPAADSESESKANFIAAARRAAQAAATMAATPDAEAEEKKKSGKSTFSSLTQHLTRRRPLMLGLAILAIAGTLHIVVNVLGTHDGKQRSAQKISSQSTPAVETAKKSVMLAPVPAKIPEIPGAAAVTQDVKSDANSDAKPETAKQDVEASPPAEHEAQPASEENPSPSASNTATSEPETTASVSPLTIASIQIPAAGAANGSGFNMAPGNWQSTPVAVPTTSQGIGPGLKAAAAAGDPAAAYEIGMRYADGRGVPVNAEEAAQWLERAASANLAPAEYRLGSLYEKGHGVKKDLERARRLYASAAAQGHAKAMHNLAVLYAEGVEGKPDFTKAGAWFRKAAAHGMADSQYNLGILHARGLGVEQNLAESYKWFALAAQQGDKDAAKKRDDVAGRLDQQALVAARLAVQTFTVQPQPEEAISVKVPAGGWEQTAAPQLPPAKSKSAGQGRRKTGA
ncbi:MAG: SEL1-like repeat protein [Rhizobiales bacterium]|nr:SEL1-like repeat protein [Hyphomicrobiales bacterium]